MKTSNLLFGKQKAFFEHSKKIRNQGLDLEAYEDNNLKAFPEGKLFDKENDMQDNSVRRGENLRFFSRI